MYFIKKNKILSLQEHLKKEKDVKTPLIYSQRIITSGLIETYGKTLNEAVKKRNEISVKSFNYMKEKTKDLNF